MRQNFREPIPRLRHFTRPVADGAGLMARILVVEDEAEVLILAETVLQQAGHEVIGAGTLAEAEAVSTSDEKFDLVVTDIQRDKDAPEGGITVGQLVADARQGASVLYASGQIATEGMCIPAEATPLRT